MTPLLEVRGLTKRFGGAMVFVILCLPEGLVGLARRRWRAARPLFTAEPPREGTVDVR